MDNDTSILELKKIVQKFCEERDWNQYNPPKDLAIGISTEAAELLDHFRFKTDKEIEEMLQNQKSKEIISDELADIFYFVLRFAQMNDIDLSNSLKNKIIKNSEKYPIEKVKGLNKKYSEYKKDDYI